MNLCSKPLLGVVGDCHPSGEWVDVVASVHLRLGVDEPSVCIGLAIEGLGSFAAVGGAVSRPPSRVAVAVSLLDVRHL